MELHHQGPALRLPQGPAPPTRAAPHPPSPPHWPATFITLKTPRASAGTFRMFELLSSNSGLTTGILRASLLLQRHPTKGLGNKASAPYGFPQDPSLQVTSWLLAYSMDNRPLPPAPSRSASLTLASSRTTPCRSARHLRPSGMWLLRRGRHLRGQQARRRLPQGPPPAAVPPYRGQRVHHWHLRGLQVGRQLPQGPPPAAMPHHQGPQERGSWACY